MHKAEEQLEAEMAGLLRKGVVIDAQEDERYSKDKRSDELPPEFQRRQERLNVLPKARVKLEAKVLQAIYGVRSERMLIDQLVYILLYHWFVGLNPDDPLWHPTTFTPTSAVDRSWRSHWNRERLLNAELMAGFLDLLMASPEVKPLLSSKHVSDDGTLLRTWASHNSLERIDGTDDDPPPPSGGKRKRFLSQLPAPLPPGQPAWPGGGQQSDAGRWRWVRATLVRFVRSLPDAHQKTLGADKGYDARDLVADLRISGITPHVAQNMQTRGSSRCLARSSRQQGSGSSRPEADLGWERCFGCMGWPTSDSAWPTCSAHGRRWDETGREGRSGPIRSARKARSTRCPRRSEWGSPSRARRRSGAASGNSATATARSATNSSRSPSAILRP